MMSEALAGKTEDEALEMANAVEYGLTGYVWTNDLTRALRVTDLNPAGDAGGCTSPPTGSVSVASAIGSVSADQATVDAATAMADTYGVVYATRGGAKSSSHYDGEAVDFTAVGLPRMVTLKAPSGKTEVFNLGAPEQTRDLSLSPELIAWVEKNFRLRKLKSDYPHWNDRK